MKKAAKVIAVIAVVCLGIWPSRASAQDRLAVAGGDAFNRAVPADFYLEGNRIPVEKRNAVLLKNAKGGRVVIALLDTAGYSSQIQQKYIGMLITEINLSVCGNALGVGSYGFGLERPAASSNSAARFRIYNQAGQQVGECGAPRDAEFKQPRPLAVLTAEPGAAKLYLGRYAMEIK